MAVLGATEMRCPASRMQVSANDLFVRKSLAITRHHGVVGHMPYPGQLESEVGTRSLMSFWSNLLPRSGGGRCIESMTSRRPTDEHEELQTTAVAVVA